MNDIEKQISKTKLPREIDILIFFDYLYHSRYFICIISILTLIVSLVASYFSNNYYNHSYTLRLNQEIVFDDKSFNNEILTQHFTNEIANVRSIFDSSLYKENIIIDYGDEARSVINNLKISDYLFNENSKSNEFATISVNYSKLQDIDNLIKLVLDYLEDNTYKSIILELKRELDLKQKLKDNINKNIEKEIINDTIYFQLKRNMGEYDASTDTVGSYVDNISLEIALKRLEISETIIEINEMIKNLEQDNLNNFEFYSLTKNEVKAQKNFSITNAIVYSLYVFLATIIVSILYHLVKLYVKYRAL